MPLLISFEFFFSIFHKNNFRMSKHHADKNSAEHSHPTAVSSSPSWIKKFTPHIIATVVYAMITLFYFSPMIADNKAMEQSDIIQAKGANHEIATYREKNNKEPLWTNSMFGGMPAFQISTFYNGNLVRFVNDVMTLGFPHPSGYLFISMLCFYLLLVSLSINPWLGLIAGIAYGLSSYNLIILETGHNSQMAAISFVPLVLAGLLMVFRKKYLMGAAVSALALSLEIRANHLQITYYLFLAILLFGIVEFIYQFKEKQWKHFFVSVGLMTGALVIGILTNLSLLWSTNEYVPSTIRGKSELTSNTQSTGGLDKDYAFQWSYGKMETFTLLIPDMFGGSSNTALSENSATAAAMKANGIGSGDIERYLKGMPTYWGAQPFTSGPTYLGALVCFLFVFGMFVIKDRMRWWVLTGSLLSIMLAWGKNLMWFSTLFFNYFPQYNKFRTVAMILVILQMLWPLIGVMALSKVVKKEIDKTEFKKYLLYSLYIVGGLCAAVALLGPAFFDFSNPSDKQQLPAWLVDAITTDRKSLMRMDALRSLFFIAAGAGAMWLYYNDKLKQNALIAVVGLIMFIDLFSVGKRYLNDDKFISKSDYNNYFQADGADQLILKDNALDYRVMNLSGNTYQDATTSYFHKSIGGYHAAKLRRYQELIESQLSKGNRGVIDMLNTRWFITKGQQQGQQQGPRNAQPNMGAMGNCWFPDSLVMANDADEELNLIGPLYEINAVNGKSVLVNGKAVMQDQIGNHDKVEFIANGDTATLEATQLNPMVLSTDTIHVEGKEFKAGMGNGTQPAFTLFYMHDFNPQQTVVVDKRFENDVKGFDMKRDSTAHIELTSYEPNHLVYKSTSAKENFAVFSEIYYQPGWVATVDGKEAPHVRANYVLRAMRVPAGTHTIEFTFAPQSFYLGEKVSMVSSGLLLLFFFGMVYMEWKKKQQA